MAGRRTQRSRWAVTALAAVTAVVSACGSGSDGAGTATTTTTITTTTTVPAPAWMDWPAPQVPPVAPTAEFAALDGVSTYCIEVRVDDRTVNPGVEDVARFLGTLGFQHQSQGCDATLAVTLAGRAEPVKYWGDLTCYLDRFVTGEVKVTIGEQDLATWTVSEFTAAPRETTSYDCAGPDEKVRVTMWTNVLVSVLYDTYGNLGLAAWMMDRGPSSLSMVLSTDEQKASFLTDPGVPVLIAAHRDARAGEQLVDYASQLGAEPSGGFAVLVPDLLRWVTENPEENLDAEWEAIAWITGVVERDPDAVWEWFVSQPTA